MKINNDEYNEEKVNIKSSVIMDEVQYLLFLFKFI